jgi:outer membrane biosynthesis protein TonB
MKQKYFLRGLASGIVVTTVILTISFNARKDDISEQEVIARAEKLGMVMAEDADSLALTVTPGVEVTEKAEITEEATVTETVEATPEPTEAEATATPTPEPTEEPKATATPTPEPTEEPKATATPTPEAVQSSSEKKVITIVSGMWSDKVARELQAMGVIEDAADFDQYLIRNGYAERLVVGTFEIPAGATYEQIAQIITRR